METARNAVTGVEYQGTNAATLGTGKWATFLQWKGAGRSIKKGEKGTRIIKFLENEVTSNKPGKPAKQTKVGFRYYTVFEEGQTQPTELTLLPGTDTATASHNTHLILD